MPIKNRRSFFPASLACFLDQNYENRELVIVDDGTEEIRHLIPEDGRIRYFKTDPWRTLGLKRNHCCELARGEYIAHWDSDDYSDPTRLQDQIDRLESTGKDVTGYGTLLFWDIDRRVARRYVPEIPNYVCGTSFLFKKSFWNFHQFRDRQVASDHTWLTPILRHVAQSHEVHMVARIHRDFTSPKSAIREVVDKAMIPEGFWANEELRLNGHREG